MKEGSPAEWSSVGRVSPRLTPENGQRKLANGGTGQRRIPKSVHAYTIPPRLGELIKDEAWRRRMSASALVTEVLRDWAEREGLEEVR
jgi:hypothetical protein